MKKLYAALGTLFISTSVFAGFAEGEKAFNSQQYSQAFSEFMPLADRGDFRAQYYIGYLYLNGYGITQNNEKALEYLNKSLKSNYDLPQALMGYLYSEGTIVPKDKKLSMELYQKAADQGNISALLNLGVSYYTGDGVTRNVSKAIEYFNKIPIPEKPVVGRYLGDIYSTETNLVNYAKAFSYYFQSAKENDLSAYHALGKMYQNGLGIDKNMIEAIKYYTYAASQNYAPSQYILGIIYANGDGIPQDKYLGYAWLYLAADKKVKGAEKARNTLMESMSLSDIEKARRKLIEIQQLVIGKTTPPLNKTTETVAEEQEQQTIRQYERRIRRRRR
ncbi:MAG: sel1 repeat family protein [Lactobacillales bacterium]|jgi:TPR repeat protein|nr:sel1 repeat family protein [Lactobacillales bacterium]